MKENSPADKQSLIESEVGEHLRFYRLCGIMAAASVVFITLLTVLVYPESMHENAYRIACLVYGPATLLLLLGMFKLFSLFFLFGVVANTQFYRGIERPLWLAQRRCKPVGLLCLIALLAALLSSGYAFRWIEKKKEDPLQWIEYRREMLKRYVDTAPQADSSDSMFKLRRKNAGVCFSCYSAVR